MGEVSFAIVFMVFFHKIKGDFDFSIWRESLKRAPVGAVGVGLSLDSEGRKKASRAGEFIRF